MRNMVRFVLVTSAILTLVAARPAQAQSAHVCFRNVPGIGSCLSGRFYEYWQQNGGLALFGYPLTSEFQQRTPSGTLTVQYFERQRFELHPNLARPSDVLLGRLGDELLLRHVGDWHGVPVPSTRPGDSCTVFEVTPVCGDFWRYWVSHGLNLATRPGVTQVESRGLLGGPLPSGSLALFGLPLTEARDETNADGFTVRTQWFERARMERYPHNPTPYIVLLGRLGAEALNGLPGTVGGISVGHDAAQHVLRLESQRDGSVTRVTYTAATRIRCSTGAQAPANVLDRPDIFVSATGVYNARGMLAASTIMTPSCA